MRALWQGHGVFPKGSPFLPQRPRLSPSLVIKSIARSNPSSRSTPFFLCNNMHDRTPVCIISSSWASLWIGFQKDGHEPKNIFPRSTLRLPGQSPSIFPLHFTSRSSQFTSDRRNIAGAAKKLNLHWTDVMRLAASPAGATHKHLNLPTWAPFGSLPWCWTAWQV